MGRTYTLRGMSRRTYARNHHVQGSSLQLQLINAEWPVALFWRDPLVQDELAPAPTSTKIVEKTNFSSFFVFHRQAIRAGDYDVSRDH